MGWKGSASALAFPFLLQWTLTQLAAILSLAFLTSARRKTLYLILAIAAAVITTSARCRWKILSPAVLSLCFALLLIVGCRNLQPWLRAGNADFADLQAAMLSLQNDLDVPGLRSKILWNLPAFHDLLPIVRKNHLSIYFKDRTKWLGQPVRQFHPEAAGFAAGKVTKTTPVPGGLEVFGWADDGRDVPHYRWIVLVNEADRIAGFGQRLPAGTAPDLTAPNAPRLLSWVGFVNSNAGGGIFRAYLVSPEAKWLIPIPGSFFPGSGE